jgi:hypothetical protein
MDWMLKEAFRCLNQRCNCCRYHRANENCACCKTQKQQVKAYNKKVKTAWSSLLVSSESESEPGVQLTGNNFQLF